MLEIVLMMAGFIYGMVFSPRWLLATILGIAIFFIKEFYKNKK